MFRCWTRPSSRPPVVSKLRAEEAIFKFNWLSATGTSLMLAAILSGLLLGIRPGRFVKLFAKTLHRVRWSLLTISAMMAIGYSTRYAGLDATLGLAFASTGKLFPFFSPCSAGSASRSPAATRHQTFSSEICNKSQPANWD